MLERKTSYANTCGQTPASQAQPLSSMPHTHHHRVVSHSRALKTMQPVSPTFDSTLYAIVSSKLLSSDYPRTLREWGRRLEANLTQDIVVKDYPALRNSSDYDAFKRKWQYLFVYAGAGFSKGYITCHMLTFIREVSLEKDSSQSRCSYSIY